MLRYLEFSTKGAAEGKLEVFFLGAYIVSVVGLVLGFNKVTILGFWYVKALGRALGDLVGI